MNPQRVPDDYLDTVVNFDLYYGARIAGLSRRFRQSVQTNLTERRVFNALGAAREGLNLPQLRWQLDLDSGYLTRLIRTWRVYGLIEVESHYRHSQIMVIRLSSLGQA